MKIIYGGSFNPPTLAHFKIAEYLLEKFPDNELIFLPVADNYTKKGLVEFKHRYKMLEIYCEKLGKRVSISDYEATLDKYEGTIKTLEHFNNPYFVIGADNLLSIEEWAGFPEVLKKGIFIIIPRNNINIHKFISNDEILCQYKNRFIILDEFEEIPISASKYRINKNKCFLDKDVEKYIKKFKLY